MVNGPGLYLADHSRLVGIANRAKSKAEDWVKRHQAGKVYDSVEDLLADPSIDILSVAATPDCHKKYKVMCAQAGKHCYVGKPIALSYKSPMPFRKAGLTFMWPIIAGE